MTKQEYNALADRYSQYSDPDLAREFVRFDYQVNELWESVDDNTSDTRECLLALIGERYVRQYSGIVWDDTKSNWAVRIVLEPVVV